MNKTLKPRILYSLENSEKMICSNRNKLVFGVCWHTKKDAYSIKEWAGGRIVKFKEVL